MTSRHGSEGGRRGIAKWIPVTIVIVVLIAAATTAYLLIVSGDDDEAAACSTQVTVPVVASPGAVEAVTAAATAFDATAPVARSACVSTSVTGMSGAAAATGLSSKWSGQSSPAPAVWVPDSAADLAAVEAGDSSLTAGRDTAPMATSPVVLAVRTGDAAALATLTWQDLAAATGPDGSIVLPSGQHLLLALPNPTINRATSYALQSVVAAGGGTVDAAAVNAAAPTLAKIAAGGPNPQPATTKDALAQLAAGEGGFSAVPVVASDLAQFSAGTPGLTGVSPAGPTVGDEVYPVALSAGWVNPAMDDAAALFLAYLRGPGGTAAFTDSGLQVGSADDSPATSPPTAASPSSGTAGQPTTSTSLPDAGPQVASALAAAIGSVPGG